MSQQARLRLVVFAALALALALRLAAAILAPNILHPDEVFQVLEPAHRLAFGSGIVPWEFKLGIRSWLLPGVFAGAMALLGRLGTDPATMVTAIQSLMILSSLLVVYCATLWGYRARGLAGAVCCGIITATWVELVYFAPHTLTEVLAAHVLVLGLYLGSPGRPVSARWRFFWSGVCLGLSAVIRFHIAPAVAIVAILIARGEVGRRWVPLALGVGAVATASGLLDAVTWGTPFQSVWLNFYVNMVDHVGATFGVQPPGLYARALAAHWGGALLLIGATAALGARRLPVAMAAALVVLVSMALVPHKEYRFIYPALVFVPILVGLGSAEIAAFLADKLALRPALVVAAVCGFWIGTSLLLASSGPYRTYWSRGAGVVRAFDDVARVAAACGVGLRGIEWWQTPGRTRLPASVGLYELTSDQQLRASAAGFNAIIGWRDAAPGGTDYRQVACWSNGINGTGEPAVPEVCLWRRAGGCTAGAAAPPVTWWPEPLRARYEGTCPSGPFCRADPFESH